ncbi:helix-hairpin-helix domain-containing protein [Streptococcus phocae]|uniref:Competence protein n=1 Tax=Streptococcus phocae TaxID=119224 RepID=A0A0P6SEL1_9STRE|nr:helix-hairpin-helix domain-containing protein [Streptococcus phocae]KPJ22674.1 competence protein [Streptococcus phocae]
MIEDVLVKVRQLLKEYYSTSHLVTGMLIVGIFVVFGVFLVGRPKSQKPANSLSQMPQSLQVSRQEPKESSSQEAVAYEKIMIDIKGEVHNEGVYQLSKGSRLVDAIEMAGGLTEQADKKAINFAEKLADEAVVYVAKIGENISVIKAPGADTDRGQPSDTQKININKASLTDLQTISGIGAKRAQDIIDLRDSLGGFQSIEELRKVSGIGEKTLEKLKNDISID